MKVIKPLVLGDAQLYSSTIPANEIPAYNSAINYPLFAQVTEGAKVYETVQTPNVNHLPSASPLYWTPVGPSNRYAMFDAEVSTQSSAELDLTVVLRPGYASSLGLFNLVGNELQVIVQDGLGGPTMYDKITPLDGTLISDWYQYFFEPSVQLREVVLTDLPPYGNAHITVKITGLSTVKCGHLTAGNAYDLGGVEYGATVEVLDFSKKNTSATGVTSFARGKSSKRVSCRTSFTNGQLNKNLQILEDLRATPCAWVGVPISGYEVLSLFGFYRGVSIEVTYATKSLCSLDIEGLT